MVTFRRRITRALAGYVLTGVALTVLRIAALTASGERRCRRDHPRIHGREVKST
jgi:branched-subunit amino acid permease